MRIDHENYLSSLRNLTEYVCGTHNEVEAPDGPPYRFVFDSHQWFLRFPSRQPVVNDFIKSWATCDKESFTDFEDLYETVKKHKVKYFGETCIYDFALRYGWNQNPRIVPKDFVYIHSKPLEAAKHLHQLGLIPELAIRTPLSNYDIFMRAGLDARDVEHLLCCYHDDIMSL